MTTCQLMTDAELSRLGSLEDGGFGALQTAHGNLPLTALSVDTRVTGLVSQMEISQTFSNSLREAIEAVYIFPLPDRAAVTRFRMEVAGRVVEGVIDERGRARQEYEEAIAAGHRAAITEEDRAGVFTLQVGNLMPGDVAVVRLTLVGPLPLDGGEVTFRFPLVVAPRYIPGAHLTGDQAGTGTAEDTDAVPDASRITPPILLPGLAGPVKLSIVVDVDGGGLPIGDFRSSLHAVTETVENGAHRVELRPPGSPGDTNARLDRDFVLRWSIGGAEVSSSAVVVPDAEGVSGTIVLTLMPPRGAALGTRRRDVIFVLDRSGSMGGWKMVAARRAVARMVDTLGENDRFAVLAFDSHVEGPPPLPKGTLAAATDRNRFRAVEFLSGLQARGGTEMLDPLVQALNALAGEPAGRDRILVLATDGQVGNEDQILRELAPRLADVRVFALGIDTAVNAAFLRRLAAVGGGACELVESEDRLDEVMAKVHRRIATPVATGLSIRGEGITIAESSWAPRRMPALFAEAPVVATARVADARAAGALLVTGKTPSGVEWSRRIEVTAGPRGDAATAIWARARIRDLEDLFAVGDRDRAEIEREIVEVSLKHRVLSRFTAFLAVDRSERVNPGGNPRTITQPVEMPSGWEMQPAQAACAPVGMAGSGLLGGAIRATQGFIGSGAGGPPPGSSCSQAKKSLFSRLRGEGSPPAKAEAAQIDAAPYLRRIREVAEAIERAAGTGDLSALDLAAARLVELIEDVRTLGGLEGLAAALDEIAARAKRFVADGSAAADLWRGVVEDLRKLADGARPAGSGRGARRGFWK